MNNITYNDLHIDALPLSGKITIRLDYTQQAYQQKWPQDMVGLPTNIGDILIKDSYRLMAVGPNELLLQCPIDAVDATIKRLQDIYVNDVYQLVEVSDYYHEVCIKGLNYALLLEKLVPFDFTPKTFPMHKNIGVRFEQTVVRLLHVEQGVIMLYRNSFHDYVMEQLYKNAREFSIAS